MEWPNSPSDLPETSNNEYFFLNLKRDLPRDSSSEDESSSASDGYQKTKVSYISIIFAVLETYQSYASSADQIRFLILMTRWKE